jgi:aldehyde:ferredoxin oxidoreductase
MGQDESSAATPLDNHNRAVNRVAVFNRLGICRINFTNVLTLMVSLYSQGILTRDQTGGMEINRDYDTVLKLAEMTARREGFGDIMADGPLGAAQRLGPEAEKQAIHIKGCSPFIDPRPDSMNSMAFAQMVHPGRSNYACGGIGIYMQGRPVEQFVHHAERTGMSGESIEQTFAAESFEVPSLTKHAEDWYSLFNSLGQCHRLYIHRFHSMDYFLEFYEAITGEEIDAVELLKRGERAWNMQKQLNVRLGFGREHDAAPESWFEPMKAGTKELPMMDYYQQKIITKTDTERMLDEYYEVRGWDRNSGAPLPQNLKALGLEKFIV